MGQLRGVRDWSRKAALATALIIWALSGLSNYVTFQPGAGFGFLQISHFCSQAGDGERAPASSHHDCLSCVACNLRDSSSAILFLGQTGFDLVPREFSDAAWPVTEISITQRRRLITQQPRAPPVFS
jgi:hypothetical protein